LPASGRNGRKIGVDHRCCRGVLLILIQLHIYEQENAMALTAEQIKVEAMKLPPTERADLADLLWISVNPREEVKAAWEVEIARRIAEIDAGTVECIPGEEVFAKIDLKLRIADARNAQAIRRQKTHLMKRSTAALFPDFKRRKR